MTSRPALSSGATSEGAHGGPFVLYPVTDVGEPEELALRPVDSLSLADDPLLRSEDLLSYDWEAHRVELTASGASALDAQRFSPSSGLPFVVTSRGKRLYAGLLWSNLSSATPRRGLPLLLVHGLERTRSITLARGWPPEPSQSTPDPRASEALRVALAEAGKLRLR